MPGYPGSAPRRRVSEVKAPCPTDSALDFCLKRNEEGPARCSDITISSGQSSSPSYSINSDGQGFKSVSAQFTQPCAKISQECSQFRDTHLREYNRHVSTVLQYPCSCGPNALGTWGPGIVSDTRHGLLPCHRPAQRHDLGILGKIVKDCGSLVLGRLASVVTNSRKDRSVPAGQSGKWI